jgi:NAD(P)-dependent dehydrogenase (short-subunit alcohol dehydrogenase family)
MDFIFRTEPLFMKISLKPLNEQVMVITGTGSGIGRAIAIAASGRGAKVILAERSRQAIDSTNRQFTEPDSQIHFVPCDISFQDQIEAVAKTAINQFGRIDSWVNSLGKLNCTQLIEASDDEIHRFFDANFWGIYNVSSVAIPYLRATAGALINIDNEISDAIVPKLGIYSALKNAVKGFIDSLRAEVQAADQQAPGSITLIRRAIIDIPFFQNPRVGQGDLLKSMSEASSDQVVKAVLEAAVTPMRELVIGPQSVADTVQFTLGSNPPGKMSARQANRKYYEKAAKKPRRYLAQPGERVEIGAPVPYIRGIEQKEFDIGDN